MRRVRELSNMGSVQKYEQEEEGEMWVFQRWEWKQRAWGRVPNIRIVLLEEKVEKPHGKQQVKVKQI